MEKKPLRVLHIEDDERDVELLKRHLTRAGYEIVSARVDTRDAMLTALATEFWDVILCDYSMPQFDALGAIKLLKEIGLDIPIIVISGTIGEEVAVEAMRLGATDYLMKNKLARLAPAIERELTEAGNRSARKHAEGEQRRLTNHLQTQAQRLDNIVDTVPGVVWESWGQPDAATHRIDFVSGYVETMVGYTVEEWLSTPDIWLSVVHPDDREAAAADAAADFVSGGDKHIRESRWVHKNGDVIWVQSHSVVIRNDQGEPIGMRGVTIDITERKKLEEQLRQAQKMEAVGQLAGGIAHDFNNLLMVITGFGELALLKLQPQDPLRQNLEEIVKAGRRAATLTRQLLAFSRKQVLQPTILNLNTVVSDLEKMLRRLIGEDIQLKTALATDLGRVKADHGQIEQVIMNLVVNARDAMPKGGKLTIETQNIFIDEKYAKQHLAITPGPYVLLSVTDNGTGMDADTQKRIFEPFFTTKGQGKGTGLGLSTVYGIVKQSGGHISVYSEVGHGTTFKVYLPRVDEEAALQQPAALEIDELDGSETILLVEDEDMVRKFVSEVLQTHGYKVLEAANGGSALLLCEKHPTPIHLLITDVIMPEMSGCELAERLVQLRPAMKVLYMSGYTDDAIVHQGVLDEGANFLQKPVSPDALLRRVREIFRAE